LSGTRVVIVISFCLFVQQGAAQVYVQEECQGEKGLLQRP
jgi:hypothetical protein